MIKHHQHKAYSSKYSCYEPDYEGRGRCRTCGGCYDKIPENWETETLCAKCDEILYTLREIPVPQWLLLRLWRKSRD